MPPLILDVDGWFTAADDAQAPNGVSSNGENNKDDVSTTVSSRSRSSSNLNTSTKRITSATTSNTSSGWITAVNGSKTDSDASSSVEKLVGSVSSILVTPIRSSSPTPEAKETTQSTTESAIFAQTTMTNDAQTNSTTGPDQKATECDSSVVPSTKSSDPDFKECGPNGISRKTLVQAILETRSEASTSSPVEKHVDDASTASSSSRTSTDAGTQESSTSTSSNEHRPGDTSNSTDKSTATEATTDSVSTVSTTAISSRSSEAETPKRLRPRAASSAMPTPALGADPKVLVGKVLTHIRRSPGHPTVTLSFADGTTYQILVDGYDPRNGSGSSADFSSSSRKCVLEMDEVLLRMLEVPGRHVVDRAITDCAHIRLADKAYERREWEQSWQQSHVAIAFKFAEERRWHCVWAMRAEYDERGCIFRAFDDVYLQALERQPPRTPQKLKIDSTRKTPSTPPNTGLWNRSSSPQKSLSIEQDSTVRSLPKPPLSPTVQRSAKPWPKTPRKGKKLGRNESWKSDT